MSGSGPGRRKLDKPYQFSQFSCFEPRESTPTTSISCYYDCCESRHGWHGCSVTYRWFLVGSVFVPRDVVRSLLEL